MKLRRRWRASVVAGLLAPVAALAAPVAVIPQPVSVTAQGGPAVNFGRGGAIAVPTGDAEAAGVARYLAATSQSTLHLTLEAASDGRVASIRLVRKPGMDPEAYALDASNGAITITASTRAGLFYGAVTLWQLLLASPQRTVPAMHIADAPRYAWRGLLIDSARHFQSVPAIERMIDVMALHKLNTLQWHLADDQGWRLAIRRYPRLTSVGAWRDSPTGRYGGFYSQSDVRRIVAYAAERQITIVPEIEMPGHALAAIRAYPARGLAGVAASSAGDWGVFPSIYNVDDATFGFLENILTEVMGLFPSHTIAIGGDEAQSGEWHHSPAIQARMKALGIKDEAALQGWFMQRIARFLADHGRRTIGWDDMLGAGGVPPGAAVLSWHDAGGAAKALSAGHDVVMATDPVLYFDHRQAAGPGEPPGRGAVIALADVYRYDPAGAAQAGNAATPGKIIGVQAQLWSEYILSDAQMLAMAWPRAAALAEVAWSPAAATDWTGFSTRLPAERDRLAALGVTPTPGAFGPMSTPAAAPGRLVSQQLKTCGNGVVLNLPGAAAKPGEPEPAMLVDIMNRCWIYPAAVLDHGLRMTAGIAALPFNYQLAGAEKSIVLHAPSGAADELVISRDSCDGPVLARISLAGVPQDRVPAAVAAALAPQPGTHDLCIFAASHAPAPLWALDWVQLTAPQR